MSGIVTEQSKEIDGVTYTTKTYPAIEGLELIRRLTELVSEEVLNLVIRSEDGELEALLADPAVLTAIVRNTMGRLGPGELGALCKDLVRHCTADKVAIGEAYALNKSVHEHFDTHFAGRYQHLLDVCVWCARVGFAKPSPAAP